MADKNPRGRNKVLRFLSYCIFSVFLIAGLFLGAVYFYADEIKAAVIGELNKNLRAEVIVNPQDIDVTILSTFPNCALRFRNVLMLEALKKKHRDTLMFAGKLDLHFDFMDLWRKKYEIHSLTIGNCVLKPAVDSKGGNNYTFWKKQESADDNSGFKLRDVLVLDARIKFVDGQSKVSTAFFVERLSLSGDFSSEQYALETNARILIRDLNVDGASYLKQKQIAASSSLFVKGDQYTLKKTLISINDLSLSLAGGFALSDNKLSAMDVNYHAADLDIASLLSLLPALYREKINGYESSGTLYAGGNIRYKEGKFRTHADFGAKEATITYVPEKTSARKINFKGSFDYGESTVTEIQNLVMELEGGSVAGNFRLEGIDDPRLTLEAEASADLGTLNRFFPIDTLENISGHLRLNVRLRGSISEMQSEDADDKVMVRAQAQVSNLVTKFKHDDKTYSVANCLLRADNSEIEVRNLELRRGSSDVSINGKLPGFVKFLFSKPVPLCIEGTLRSTHLDVNDFISGEEKQGEKNEDPLIPAKLVLKVTSNINELKFGKFEADDLSGEIEIKDQKLLLSDVNLKTMQGAAVFNAYADNHKGRLNVSVESTLKKINIAELFRQMNDFGQTTLQENNIKGYATAELSFSGSWSNALESDPASIRSTCDLTIDKGELIGLSALSSLARFVDVKELERIRFGQLTSRIEISGQKILIPRTSIKNSAINLEFWGSHTFAHNIDYHFQLLTRDLLQARKKKSGENEEFGEVARDDDNTRSVFIVMTGNLDNPKIRYDKQGMQQKINNDIRKERQNLKLLIKEEIALIKRGEAASPGAAGKTDAFKIEEPEKKPAKQELVLKKKEEDDF